MESCSIIEFKNLGRTILKNIKNISISKNATAHQVVILYS